MGRDESHYQYDSYTTGRKQDYGHHELNVENGWICYSWNRDDYTETMEMKKPLEGKGWKPFRVYTYPSTFEDFITIEEAQAYFDAQCKGSGGWVNMVEVNTETGETCREIAKFDKSKQVPMESAPAVQKEIAVFDVNEKINNFKSHADEFMKDLRNYQDELKSKMKAFTIIESLRWMEGDYVWVMNPNLIHLSTGMFNIEKTYLPHRAKFNADGTDNRLELQFHEQHKDDIKQQFIRAICYGDPSNSYSFHNREKEKRWWFKADYHSSDWIDETLIAKTKEELITRWHRKYEDLRDAFFTNYYTHKEADRQRAIKEAKRVLEQNGAV